MGQGRLKPAANSASQRDFTASCAAPYALRAPRQTCSDRPGDVFQIHGARFGTQTLKLGTVRAVQQHMTSSHAGPIHQTGIKIHTRREGPPGRERERETGSCPQPRHLPTPQNQCGGQCWGVLLLGGQWWGCPALRGCWSHCSALPGCPAPRGTMIPLHSSVGVSCSSESADPTAQHCQSVPPNPAQVPGMDKSKLTPQKSDGVLSAHSWSMFRGIHSRNTSRRIHSWSRSRGIHPWDPH